MFSPLCSYFSTHTSIKCSLKFASTTSTYTYKARQISFALCSLTNNTCWSSNISDNWVRLKIPWGQPVRKLTRQTRDSVSRTRRHLFLMRYAAGLIKRSIKIIINWLQRSGILISSPQWRKKQGNVGSG